MGTNNQPVKETYTELQLNDMDFLDSIPIDAQKRKKGLILAFLLTALGIFIFFVPVNISGKSENLFAWLYNWLMTTLGIYGLWLCCILMVLNTIACFIGKFAAKQDTPLYRLYDGDSKLHPFIYLLGAVYMVIYMMDKTFSWYTGPAFICSAGVGGTIIDGFIPSFLWVTPLCGLVLPLLLSYGGIDFVGTLMEPMMRKGYHVPGKSAVDAVSSFFASSSVAVLITNKLYRSKVYTEREAVIITTGFSAVSVGFAAVVINGLDLGEHFTAIYFFTLALAFVVTAICCRIPPISRKRDIFVDGTVQTEAMRKDIKKEHPVRLAADRAAKKAYYADNYFTYAKNNLLEALGIVPKLLCFATAAGVTCLILAEYTPVFEWIGMVLQPLIRLMGIGGQEAVVAATALPTGLAEMYLPALIAKGSSVALSEGTRFFVASVSIVQMIFFSESASLQLALKMPVKAWELVVVFIERTLIAIPLVALVMHIFF